MERFRKVWLLSVILAAAATVTACAAATYSSFWYQDQQQVWHVKDNTGTMLRNKWFCDDAIAANGKNVWYLLDENGNMISDGLVQDGTGNYYSLETNHNGYFGMLRYQSGTYDGIYLELENTHNGSFAAIKNQDGINALKAKYGLRKVSIDNSNIVYSSNFSSVRTQSYGSSGGGSSSGGSSSGGSSSGGSSSGGSSSGGSSSGGSTSGGSSSGGSSSGGSTSGGGTSGGGSASETAITAAKNKAVTALLNKLNECNTKVYVYKDYSSVLNHFTQKSKIYGNIENRVKDMNEYWTEDPASGSSCIRCEQTTSTGDWGGWMFLNGVMAKGDTAASLNQGTSPGQGMDLTGATKLTFMAKGAEGGEIVEFYTCGFGYEGGSSVRTVTYPDSCLKQSLGFVTLTDQWKEYTISLTGLDMSNIACGFGFVLNGSRSGNRENVFYLDDICFHGSFRDVKPMLRSYAAAGQVLNETAYTYDNALVAMAFLSEGMKDEAAQILDSFVYASDNDRYKAGRIRNAYACGDIRAFKGWETGARLPGWYDNITKQWCEDRTQVGSNVGNTSYAALALLAYDTRYGSTKYRNTAAKLMDWVLEECTDSGNGFTAGYDGWPENGNGTDVYKLTYKSTEHNIDAYAAFRILYQKTGDQKYADAAQSALDFIISMYDSEQKYFMTGTGNDGVTPNRDIVVLDTQVWTALALGDKFTPYLDALGTAYGMKTADGGYPFYREGGTDGWWPEGTAFTALTWKLQGEDQKAEEALNALVRIQHENGVLPAATAASISTGLYLYDGTLWVYEDNEHIAPTAWFILAVNGFNPYDVK